MSEKKIHELPLADTIGESDIILIGNPSTGALKKATRGLLESYAKAYADGLVTGLLDDRGNWNPGSGGWPDEGGSGVDGAIKKGDVFYLTADGTLTGPVEVKQGDSLRALVDDPGQDAESWGVMDKGMVLQTLGETLARGNSTDEHDIVVTEGDRLVVGSNRAGVGKGTFDNGTGGDKGVSIFCAVGKELNFQGGVMRVVQENDTDFVAISLDAQSAIRYVGRRIDLSGVTKVNGAYGLSVAIDLILEGDQTELFKPFNLGIAPNQKLLGDNGGGIMGIWEVASITYDSRSDTTIIEMVSGVDIYAGASLNNIGAFIVTDFSQEALLPIYEADRRYDRGRLIGQNYEFVKGNLLAFDNGTALKNAYVRGTVATPYGNPLAADNRYTIIVGSGTYDVDITPLILDTQYIDIVSLSGQMDVVLTSVGLGGSPLISVTAPNVRVTGIEVKTDAFHINNDLSDIVITNCKGGDYSFGGDGAIVSGRFIGCIGGNNSFGGLLAISQGYFKDCSALSRSFASQTDSLASGTFINCVADANSFGGNGGTFSGKAVNCTGGDKSFGGDGIFEVTGVAISCQLTSGYFPVLIALGIIRNCLNFDYSKADNEGGTGNGYLVCTGLLSQSGTAAPILSIWKNELGYVPTTARINSNYYTIGLTEASGTKAWAIFGSFIGQNVSVYSFPTTEIWLQSADPMDDNENVPFEIRVKRP